MDNEGDRFVAEQDAKNRPARPPLTPEQEALLDRTTEKIIRLGIMYGLPLEEVMGDMEVSEAQVTEALGRTLKILGLDMLVITDPAAEEQLWSLWRSDEQLMSGTMMEIWDFLRTRGPSETETSKC